MEKTNYNQVIINNLLKMNDSDKIMYIVEKVFNATSPETAVTMEQIVEKGIEMGITEDYPRGKEDGHPWWPHTSVMMGVGTPDQVMNWEEIHLHRKKMHKINGKVAMFYWVDKTKKHERVARSSKSCGINTNSPKKSGSVYMREEKKSFTPEEMEKKVAENPGMFIIWDGKLYTTKFIIEHPEKFNQVLVIMAKKSKELVN